MLPGGEVGILRGWWNSAEEQEWRWQVEFFNRRRAPAWTRAPDRTRGGLGGLLPGPSRLPGLPAFPVVLEGDEHGDERAALFGKAVLGAGRVVAVEDALHHAAVFEALETLGEQVGRDAVE